jgi:hypothetical protein
MAIAVSTNAPWLRGMPRCRTEGSMVYVTLLLEPSKATGPACVAWSAGGLHATTPKIKGASVTCCVPLGAFQDRALVTLQMIDSAESDKPILAWTQIPVLEETMFRAEMVAGRPVLSPLVQAPPLQPGSRVTASALDL